MGYQRHYNRRVPDLRAGEGRITIAGEDWAVIAVREGHGVACSGRCERKSHDWCKAPE